MLSECDVSESLKLLKSQYAELVSAALQRCIMNPQSLRVSDCRLRPDEVAELAKIARGIPNLVVTLGGDHRQYRPKEDVTAYEIALMLPFLLTIAVGGSAANEWDEMPLCVQRHFERLL